ncbi:hypothetical protein AVME950_19080 [Acidovorax sp. SUPP950]|uniref:hypothetical protein n=1 Tax=unclassified Acidovorax TaxID=2684926 RepID=UPI00234BAD3C|nr:MULTISPECIES: hypothetical protein [Comamonadaceae]WCM97307.1 hypothetical protein M5C96_23435 [Acidovorax sp. GBBC 1281]WOI44548.1 hypothetical protein R1Z03_18740 [Paracidovorax avenae]GKS77034.1 hypothetical protein AVME950_19080 [Acidovorax sp. SUPP950]GKT00820.1 hypothetical protein AVKW3434_15545 [Acidovorax sp. SUPP3434]GKT18773.1 hypothetical protein AVHY2522_20055 [Acidovorax sp. SUPP2522]
MVNKADGDTKALMARMQQQQDNQNAMTELQAKLSERQGRNSVISNMADAFQKSSKSMTDKLAQAAG